MIGHTLIECKKVPGVKKSKTTGKETTYTYYTARCTVTEGKMKGKRISATAAKKQEAVNKLEKKLKDLGNDTITAVPVRSEHLEDALNHFCDKMLSEGQWKTSTYARYKSIIKSNIEGRQFGDLNPLEIDSDEITYYIWLLENYGRSASEQKKFFALLRAYYSKVFEGQDFKNPTRNIAFPTYKPEISSSNVYDSDEVKKLMEACANSNNKYADIVLFMLINYTRIGETLVLKFSDWDRKANRLYIRRTWRNDSKGHPTIGPENSAKTSSSVRNFTLDKISTSILEKRYEAHTANKDIQNTDWIFPSPEDVNKPLLPVTLRKNLKKIEEECGIKLVSAHGLRHSGISYYAQDANSRFGISKKAGHSKTDTTEQIYTHLFDKDKDALANKADKMNKKLLNYDLFSKLSSKQ